MNQEDVFKALADEHRRPLLDALFRHDGQSLNELTALLPMTRYGVMKHLQVLEGAGLITTRKVGREKHHYLNPVPIQLVYERWVSKFAQPWAQTMTGLKFALEDTHMSNEIPAHVYHIFIKTTPEKLWQALTDGTITAQYYFGTQVESDWQSGSEYTHKYPDGGVMIQGKIVEIDPPKRLVQTFVPNWYEHADPDHPSTVIWEIEAVGEVCKLTLTHRDLDPQYAPADGIKIGWGQILSSLKSLLETGEPLTFGG